MTQSHFSTAARSVHVYKAAYLTQILVERLTKNVTKGHIDEIFGSYGAIKQIEMSSNTRCEKTTLVRLLTEVNFNRGICYVEYENPEAAESAFYHMDDGYIDGCSIAVSRVRPHRPEEVRRGFPQRDRPSAIPRGNRQRIYQSPSFSDRSRSPYRRRQRSRSIESFSSRSYSGTPSSTEDRQDDSARDRRRHRMY